MVGVVGLGYVGLPLAVMCAKAGYPVRGYDLDAARVEAANDSWLSSVREVSIGSFRADNDPAVLIGSSIFVVAVPTPVDSQNQPDLEALELACQTIAPLLDRFSLVVIESSVFPGTVRNVVKPILEVGSQLRCGDDFALAHSPERVNPGDLEHSVDRIPKLVAGFTDACRARAAELYRSVLSADVIEVDSLEVAELSKLVENTQRDVNIALMNELEQFAWAAGIEFNKVLEACMTKWNFVPFHPGLVGGHCIAVDPYYLIARGRQIGARTQLVETARYVNTCYTGVLASRLMTQLDHRQRVLVHGVTFKPNIDDCRNSGPLEVAKTLGASGFSVDIWDTLVDVKVLGHVADRSGLTVAPTDSTYTQIVCGVSHSAYPGRERRSLRRFRAPGCIYYDVSGRQIQEIVTEKEDYL